MDDPEGRVQQGDILHQHALAVKKVDELRAQAVLRAEGALRRAVSLCVGHGHSVLAAAQQARACLPALRDAALLPSEVCHTDPRPPGLVAAAAIDSTSASNSDVGLPAGVDAGREIKAVKAFPCSLDDGIEFRFKGEAQRGAFLDVQFDMAFQMDGTRKESSSRNDYAAATPLRAFVNGFLYGFLIIGCRRVNAGTELRNDIVLAANLRFLDALFYLLIDIGIPLVSLCNKRDQPGKQQQ